MYLEVLLQPGKSMINVKNLRKTYGDVVAVDDVSFEAKKGDIVGFIGPNGAGKTTTLRMLACFIEPDSGSATASPPLAGATPAATTKTKSARRRRLGRRRLKPDTPHRDGEPGMVPDAPRLPGSMAGR